MNTHSTIIQRSIVITAVLIVVAGLAYGARAGFPETAATFNTGGLEFKIDSKAYYNGAAYPASTWALKNLVPGTDKFFMFGDVKPGDIGSTTVSIHLKKSPAWVCLDFSNFKDKENTIDEPESHVDVNGTATGELGHEMEFFAWFDDGDGKFRPPEKPLFGTSTSLQSAIKTIKDVTYALSDYKHGPAWADGSTHYVGIAWCAGDLSVNLTTGAMTCNANAMGNEAQTDSLSIDATLRAVASSDNAKFSCLPEDPKDHVCHKTGDKKHPYEIVEVNRSACDAYLKQNTHDYKIESDRDEKDCRGGKDHDDGHLGHGGDDHYVSHGFFDYGHGTCSPVGNRR